MVRFRIKHIRKFKLYTALAQPNYTSEECLVMAKARNPAVPASIERTTQAEQNKEVTTRERNNFRMGIYVDQPLFTSFRLTDTYNLADLGLKEAVAGEQ